MSSPELTDDDESFDASVIEIPQHITLVEISSDDDEFDQPVQENHQRKQNEAKNAIINRLFGGENSSSVQTARGSRPKIIIGRNKPKTLNEWASSPKVKPNIPVPSSSSIFNNESRISNNVTIAEAKPPQQFAQSIGGVEVHFPVKPYSCQIALMFKVITGMSKSQNCLLESPTGSGKTLALLCAALAWQRKEKSRIAALVNQQLFSECPEDVHTGAGVASGLDAAPDLKSFAKSSPDKLSFQRNLFGEKSIYDNVKAEASSGALSSPAKRDQPIPSTPPEEELVSIHKRLKKSPSSTPSSARGGAASTPTTPNKPTQAESTETPQSVRELSHYLGRLALRSMVVDSSLPTIYYGARTHKQLQQVIKEFKRTTYLGEAKMTILSSREYSCIRPFDRSIYSSKGDMCREVTKPKWMSTFENKERVKEKESTSCVFFDNKRLLHCGSLAPAFDLEDLIQAGYETNACPYYAARAMADSAHIIFCPYNYLIDPAIRSSMSINLEDSIVILDEAHNIEDVCREAASFTFTARDIANALSEVSRLTQYETVNQDIMGHIVRVSRALDCWEKWFADQRPLVNGAPVSGTETVHKYQPKEFSQSLERYQMAPDQLAEFSNSVAIFAQRFREDSRKLFGITSTTVTFLESLCTVLGYMYREGSKHADDYRPTLVRAAAAAPGGADGAGWKSTLSNNKLVEGNEYSLRLLCMSPALVFAALRVARTVVLSSGTLSPMLSLHSELGAAFPQVLSTAHVIAPDRVWVGSLSSGAQGQGLECTARGAARPDVQDALGETLLWTCKVTPHGVLCFLPSYHLMNTLIKRWEETGLWSALNAVKSVFAESRNVRDHSDVMDAYYDSVGVGGGALLLAVYRGKVSEGMDFKDRQARTVVAIGIPYPNMYDLMVSLKMAYNDKHCRDRSLLPSKDWLRMQAYRALNQAAGRCVRHRGDWGAMLLVDARFQQPYYTEHLSKWLRTFLGQNHHTWQSLTQNADSLESFMKHMTLRDTEEMCD